MCYILNMFLLSFIGHIEPWQYALIMLGIVLLSALLFALTGFIIVKRNCVAIIERIGNFVGIYKPGVYYFAPLLYRRVGMYRIGETNQIIDVNRIEYKITYEIIDVKKFHYIGKHDIKGVLVASLNDNKDNLSQTLIKHYEQIGVKFITLEKIIKR